jgi:ABC-type Zn2+ transport system substrate-binding protein/surface adhesin
MLEEVASKNCLLQKLDHLRANFVTLQENVARLDSNVDEILKLMKSSTHVVFKESVCVGEDEQLDARIPCE